MILAWASPFKEPKERQTDKTDRHKFYWKLQLDLHMYTWYATENKTKTQENVNKYIKCIRKSKIKL